MSRAQRILEIVSATHPKEAATPDKDLSREFLFIIAYLTRMQDVVTFQRWTNKPGETANIKSLQRVKLDMAKRKEPFYQISEEPMDELQRANSAAMEEAYRRQTVEERVYVLGHQLELLDAIITTRSVGRCASKRDLDAFDTALDEERDMIVARCEEWERCERLKVSLGKS